MKLSSSKVRNLLEGTLYIINSNQSDIVVDMLIELFTRFKAILLFQLLTLNIFLAQIAPKELISILLHVEV